jgi:hypothetical protein
MDPGDRAELAFPAPRLSEEARRGSVKQSRNRGGASLAPHRFSYTGRWRERRRNSKESEGLRPPLDGRQHFDTQGNISDCYSPDVEGNNGVRIKAQQNKGRRRRAYDKGRVSTHKATHISDGISPDPGLFHELTLASKLTLASTSRASKGNTPRPRVAHIRSKRRVQPC